MALISEILNAALSDDGKALRVEILGGIGGNSMRFLSGVTDPTSDIGVPGDVYLNTTSGDLFRNDNGTWNLLMNLVNTLDYSTVSAVTDVYTIDFANSPVKNVKIETEDTNAKTVALANVPTGDAELFIELTYTNAAAITWFAGITWLSGAAPTFETGKVYRIALFKYGTGWHGNCVGGW